MCRGGEGRRGEGGVGEGLGGVEVAGRGVRIGEYDVGILGVQDKRIEQVKGFRGKPVGERGAE